MIGLEEVASADTISFPGLGINNLHISRVAFNLFGKDVYWYGIIIAVGFLLAVIYGMWLAEKIGIKSDDIIDIVLFAAPASIIFARLYYVVFRLDYYNTFMKVISIWEGGIAIYGAIIGAFITALLVCKYKKLNALKVFDIGAMGFMIGQFIGRWGNFVNREAFGTATKLPWRMEILDPSTYTYVAVHPTFLYESLWNLIGFIILHFYFKHRKFNGEVFLLYTAWYGAGRCVIEGLRTDSLMWGSVRVSQILGAVLCLLSIAAILFIRARIQGESEGKLMTLAREGLYDDIIINEDGAENSDAGTSENAENITASDAVAENAEQEQTGETPDKPEKDDIPTESDKDTENGKDEADGGKDH